MPREDAAPDAGDAADDDEPPLNGPGYGLPPVEVFTEASAPLEAGDLEGGGDHDHTVLPLYGAVAIDP
jgi:hypothetical protein